MTKQAYAREAILFSFQLVASVDTIVFLAQHLNIMPLLISLRVDSTLSWFKIFQNKIVLKASRSFSKWL